MNTNEMNPGGGPQMGQPLDSYQAPQDFGNAVQNNTSQVSQGYIDETQSYGYQPQQTYQPQQYNQQAYYQAPQENKGLAITSMVLGIVSLLIECSGLWIEEPVFWLSIPVAVAAIVLAAVNKSKYGKNAMATAGLVCGIVSLALMACIIILAVFVLATSFAALAAFFA